MDKEQCPACGRRTERSEEQKKKLEEAEADLEQEKERRKDLQRQNVEQGKQIEELRKEADSYEKSWFGFYRKRGV